MKIAVTGASGYIASHVVRVLLAAGHEVRATVRDPEDQRKTGHLLALPGSERLKLFSADLQDDGSFDEAFTGCEGVCHVASPVNFNPRDPRRDIIEPAVRGTRNAMRAAERAATVRRVVLTSSAAAVAGWEAPDGTYREDQWNATSRANRSAYPLAKTLAEKAAWEFVEDRALELVTILPTYVFGPVMTRAHFRSSPAFIHHMVTGKLPLCPNLNLPVVDVEAVAQAHRAALEQEHARGRYLLANENRWLAEIAKVIRDKHPELPAPKRQAPDLLVYLSALFDKETNVYFWRCSLGQKLQFDGTRVNRELGVGYAAWDKTILETVASVLELGED